MIQRRDATALAANWDADPEFGETLCRASRTGVRVSAMVRRVGPSGVRLATPVRRFQ